ncbi:hypothetical protein J7J26_03345 [Candidatus Micrarchaeota archaeon]|nr:hypothetical protein [Candidatus Micrarchaeota archaeon]
MQVFDNHCRKLFGLFFGFLAWGLDWFDFLGLGCFVLGFLVFWVDLGFLLGWIWFLGLDCFLGLACSWFFGFLFDWLGFGLVRLANSNRKI